MAELFGCIEAGGTKFMLGVARGPGAFLESRRLPTLFPGETIGDAVDWLREAAARHGALAAVGIASFGPAETDPASARWGRLGATPKPGWQDADMARAFARKLDVPVGFDTDVNAAALAEARWGAARNSRTSAYVTVGTGIGAGVVMDGRLLRGGAHPEVGHIRVARHPADSFGGSCPFHGDCVEGLASGTAINARWGAPLSRLAEDEADMIAFYLAQLAVAIDALLAPDLLVMGGGVMAVPGLHDRVGDAAAGLSAGYFRAGRRLPVVAPGLGEKAGLSGALLLAMAAAGAELG